MQETCGHLPLSQSMSSSAAWPAWQRCLAAYTQWCASVPWCRAECTAVDTEKRKIACKDADGLTFETGYDHLVIATGSQVLHQLQCRHFLSGWVKQGSPAPLPATSVCMNADACMWQRRTSALRTAG